MYASCLPVGIREGSRCGKVAPAERCIEGPGVGTCANSLANASARGMQLVRVLPRLRRPSRSRDQRGTRRSRSGLSGVRARAVAPVNLESVDTRKRASANQVSLFEVSHCARFARALAVTTFRHSCGPILVQLGTNFGPSWDQAGTSLGPIWDQSGTNLGPIWDQSGTNLGPIWDRSGTNVGTCLGQLWRAKMSILA